ncbi:exodeoxyribonuclease VII small subunit [Slackia exigua]
MEDQRGFTEIRDRLTAIDGQVREEGVTLDEALALYDEAVKLGMQATDLLEQLISTDDDAVSGDPSPASPEAIGDDTASGQSERRDGDAGL